MRVITAILLISAITFCAADDNASITQAGQTIQKLLNERIGKKIVEAAKEVKGILSKSLGSHVKQATAKLIIDNAVDKLENQVTQNDGVATVGTDQSADDCVKDCKLKKLAKQGETKKPHVHRVHSMHKGAPSHKTPHNKGPRHRKQMPGPNMPQMPNQGMQQQQQPPPNPNVPTMPQTPPQPACQPPCPSACAPACTQDCCRPMLSLIQLPPPPPPYYPPPPPPMPMCAPPCTQPSCAPACPQACCSAPPPPPPPPPPPVCPPICVQHCYTICPRGCCRTEIAHKKEKISHDNVDDEAEEEGEDNEEEAGAIISNRKSGNAESNPMQRNKIPKRKVPTYNTVH